MTRGQLIEHWDIIQAFKEGKEIECYNGEFGEWEPITEPSFFTYCIYRVKPESKKPKYRVYQREERDRLFDGNDTDVVSIQQNTEIQKDSLGEG